MGQSNSKKTRQTEFLTALVDSSGNKVKAGKVANVPRQTYHRWFKDDEDFKSKADEIFPQIERKLLEECIKRAKEKSDILMIFTLKALNPVRYDDGVRKHQLLNQKHEDSSAKSMKQEDIQSIIMSLLKEDPFLSSSLLCQLKE